MIQRLVRKYWNGWICIRRVYRGNFGKKVADAQRPEQILRNKFKYLKRKTGHSAEVLALLDEIQSRTTTESAATTCKKVLDWMEEHNWALPKQIIKPTTDAQRAEYSLRNKLKYIKRETQPPAPGVCAARGDTRPHVSRH